MAPMKIYMVPGSCSTGIHISRRTRWYFEAYVVNLRAGDHFKPDYVAVNPKSTIRALARRDGRLTDARAIACWLGRCIPRQPVAYGRR